MPAATLIAATLAALEPPRQPVRPLAILQTSWSLSASPQALASSQQPPIIGPGQIVTPVPLPPAAEDKKRQVTVLPAADEPADNLDFEALEDPVAPHAATPTDPTEAATSGLSPDQAESEAAVTRPPAGGGGVDPLEAELAQSIKPTNDPLEGFNRISFAFSMVLDKIAIRPLALGYQKIAPKPLRDGIRNVLNNWGEPMVFVNDLLQFKPKRAIRTLGRFLLNTLLGIGGLFDIAKEKKFNLPFHGNRFSNTLGFYGIKPGPFIYLPILGPTTLRDQGDRVQQFIPFIANPIFEDSRGAAMSYTSMLELRANNDVELKALLDEAVDPYATFRETWLQQRQGEIDGLKAPDGVQPGSVETLPDSLADPLVDPAAPTVPEPVAIEAPTLAP